MEMKITKPRIGWKILKKGMKSQYNDFHWKKNKWYKHEGELNICYSGFHASKELVSAMNYLVPGIICEVEYKGEVIEDNNKFVASEMRIIETYKVTKKQWVEWSIYCARSVLKNWTKHNSTDKRPLAAIEAAENWLKNPTKKNKDLAESAAESAARSATRSARSAESARSAARSARSAWLAWSARSAAESAARSARSARSAAESAARSAAWSAAESAAKKKLHKKLLIIIKGK